MNIFENTVTSFVFFYNWIKKLQRRQDDLQNKFEKMQVDTTYDVDELSSKVSSFELSQRQDLPYHKHDLIDINGLSAALNSKANIHHLHDIVDINNLQNSLNAKADKIHTHSLDDILNLQGALDGKASVQDLTILFEDFDAFQTTLIGLLNDDLAQKADINHQHVILDIENLQNILDSKANIQHDHDILDINNLQNILNSKSNVNHSHGLDSIIGLNELLLQKANLIHKHDISDITNLQSVIDGKASVYHNHNILDIVNLQASLDSKAPFYHTQDMDSINGLVAVLAAKASLNHNHGISQITGLQEALNARASLTHQHSNSDLPWLQALLDAKANLNHTHIISDITNLQSELNSIPKPATEGGLSDTALGTAGSSAKFAREDHTHPVPSGINTLLGSVVVSQTATVALNLGIREVVVTLNGATVGERYQAFCRSYRLATTGSFIPGRPAGYTILDCTCNAANQITVSLNAPLLAIGSTYQMNVDVVRIKV